MCEQPATLAFQRAFNGGENQVLALMIYTSVKYPVYELYSFIFWYS